MCGCRNVCSLWQGREKQTLSPVDFVALTASLRGSVLFLPWGHGWQDFPSWKVGGGWKDPLQEARRGRPGPGAEFMAYHLHYSVSSVLSNPSTSLPPLGHEPPPPICVPIFSDLELLLSSSLVLLPLISSSHSGQRDLCKLKLT